MARAKPTMTLDQARAEEAWCLNELVLLSVSGYITRSSLRMLEDPEHRAKTAADSERLDRRLNKVLLRLFKARDVIKAASGGVPS